jgi:PTH1 family peptidyl-tRNA hydrolase
MLKFFKKSGPVSWMVVFLGNPGSRYDGTRHNAGFMAADACEKSTGADISRARFHALTAQTKVGDEGVLLVKPQTFMNLSGQSVGEAAKFYKIPAEHVIVVSDDVSLAPGQLRVRRKGSAGGHNGLKSIISALGSEDFPRVKIGVGQKPHPDYDMADWVLAKITGKDAELVNQAAEKAWEAASCYIQNGPEKTMNKFN